MSQNVPKGHSLRHFGDASATQPRVRYCFAVSGAGGSSAAICW